MEEQELEQELGRLLILTDKGKAIRDVLRGSASFVTKEELNQLKALGVSLENLLATGIYTEVVQVPGETEECLAANGINADLAIFTTIFVSDEESEENAASEQLYRDSYEYYKHEQISEDHIDRLIWAGLIRVAHGDEWQYELFGAMGEGARETIAEFLINEWRRRGIEPTSGKN